MSICIKHQNVFKVKKKNSTRRQAIADHLKPAMRLNFLDLFMLEIFETATFLGARDTTVNKIVPCSYSQEIHILALPNSLKIK